MDRRIHINDRRDGVLKIKQVDGLVLSDSEDETALKNLAGAWRASDGPRFVVVKKARARRSSGLARTCCRPFRHDVVESTRR